MEKFQKCLITSRLSASRALNFNVNLNFLTVKKCENALKIYFIILQVPVKQFNEPLVLMIIAILGSFLEPPQ